MSFNVGDVVRVTAKQPAIAATVQIATPDSDGRIVVELDDGRYWLIEEDRCRLYATAFLMGDSITADGSPGTVLAIDDLGNVAALLDVAGVATVWVGPVASVAHR